jgi:hypothetical protein
MTAPLAGAVFLQSKFGGGGLRARRTSIRLYAQK